VVVIVIKDQAFRGASLLAADRLASVGFAHI